MAYPAGVAFLTLAAILLSVFSRKFFFGDGAAGLMDFSELFYWGQWIGFWCTVLSLCSFALAAHFAPFPLISRRAVPPALALALCLSFLAFSIPEWSNKDGWRKGAIGWKVYVDTKVRLWRERREAGAREATFREAFYGRWKTAEGATLVIERGKVMLDATEFSLATCADGAFRSEMASKTAIGMHFYRAGLVMSPQYKRLPEGRYPLLTYTCNGRDASFMAIEPRQLFVVLPDGTAMTFTR